MLILSKYIIKHELKPLSKYFSIDDLIDGAKKVIKGLGQEVNPSKVPKSYKFFKVRIGGRVKGRMIVFIVAGNQKVAPILIRLKRDKKIGMNMSTSNPHVVELIDRNVQRVIKDIENGNFEEFGLEKF